MSLFLSTQLFAKDSPAFIGCLEDELDIAMIMDLNPQSSDVYVTKFFTDRSLFMLDFHILSNIDGNLDLEGTLRWEGDDFSLTSQYDATSKDMILTLTSLTTNEGGSATLHCLTDIEEYKELLDLRNNSK